MWRLYLVGESYLMGRFELSHAQFAHESETYTKLIASFLCFSLLLVGILIFISSSSHNSELSLFFFLILVGTHGTICPFFILTSNSSQNLEREHWIDNISLYINLNTVHIDMFPSTCYNILHLS